ncbi:cytochrome c-type biogenesis protein CcmH [bacterium]|nr:cytochrome c-type biogenesis protein CcmH [bacterium]
MILALVMAIATAAEAPLDDPRAEQRAQTLMREIRCVVCENEPVSQSTADVARDMRRLIREQIAEGATNAEVRDYFSDRYGDFVLFRPRADGARVLIWGFPLILLLGGAVVLGMRAMRMRRKDLAPVGDDRDAAS